MIFFKSLSKREKEKGREEEKKEKNTDFITRGDNDVWQVHKSWEWFETLKKKGKKYSKEKEKIKKTDISLYYF